MAEHRLVKAKVAGSGRVCGVPYLNPEDHNRCQRELVARRRALWFAENGPCVDCGSWSDLELDHVDAAQKVSHRLWSWAEERRNLELAKCRPRCHACHVKKRLGSMEHSHGEGRPDAKLTELIVREIRASSEPSRVLAERYGVHQRIIQKVRKRDLWKHI